MNHSRIRYLLVAVLACASASHVTTAVAQPASALGKPLASPDLPVGTVTVKMVAGKQSSPVIGTDVTLVVNGQPRMARTDAAGRANFANLATGATVQAKAINEAKEEVSSESFTVSGESGSRVMLTTRPWVGMGGGGGEPAAGAPGMPSPRALSGQPRLEQTYEVGTLTILASYDDLADLATNTPISLVGYGSDDSITVTVKPTNEQGRVVFRDLDRSGNTVYFVMAQLPRNGALDRTYTKPLEVDGRGGIHLMLSGEKRASTLPPADDLTEPQHLPTPADKVRVIIAGAPELPVVLKAYDAATKQVVAEGTATQQAADPTVRFHSAFLTRTDLPAGFVGVLVHGGGGGGDARLANMEVAMVPVDGNVLGTPFGTTTTDSNGQAVVKVPPGMTAKQFEVVATVNGKSHTSEAFEVTANGGQVEVVANWEARGRIEAMIDVPHIAGRVLYVEAINRKQRYRSKPFQTIPTAGTQLDMFFYPRTLFTFKMFGQIEDQLLGVQGMFTITNYSWAPYKAGPDGLVIPLPKGFKGVFVHDDDQAEVSSDPNEGFRILRPIPPGGKTFQGGFSLPTKGGRLDWSLDLPNGTFGSSLKILKVPGMTVNAPMTVDEATMKAGGDIYLMEPITILPQKSMTMTLQGVPSLPGWRVWVPRILGLSVIAIMLAGVVFAVVRRRAVTGASVERHARREQLLGELVELDRSGGKADKDKRRRETLIVELEALWGDD